MIKIKLPSGVIVIDELREGCWVAEWQSRADLHRMSMDVTGYPDGPVQESAVRQVAVTTRKDGIAVLKANKTDTVNPTLAGPYWWRIETENSGEGWDYDNYDPVLE